MGIAVFAKKVRMKVNKLKYKKSVEGNEDNCKEVFSAIYANSLWGGERGELYSGPGSHNNEYIRGYIDYLIAFIKSRNISSICEIGSGDFYIMNQVLNENPDTQYIGIDVVPEIVEYTNKKYGNTHVEFKFLDASKKEVALPNAELLIIRQVLQHLDNDKIQIILNKTKKYQYTLITEHLYSGEDVVYNIDKKIGMDIRFDMKSGVFIDKGPFSIHNSVIVLEIPCGEDAILRTWLVTNIEA